jgi:hypothetical protein
MKPSKKRVIQIPVSPMSPPAYYIKTLESFDETLGRAMGWEGMRKQNVRQAMEQAWVDLGMDVGYTPQEMEDIGDYVEEVVENVLRTETEFRRDVLNEVTHEVYRRRHQEIKDPQDRKKYDDAFNLIQEIVEELKKKNEPR